MATSNPNPRCQVIPQEGHSFSIRIDGQERLRWNFGDNYPRPFFYPFNGPSGACLTRMGHPGAPNHDHHQSVWFAHDKVMGIDFWANKPLSQKHLQPVVRQKEWLAIEDADDDARFAVRLGWYDGHDPQELLEQIVIVVVRPHGKANTLTEIQTEFIPKAESLEFQQTNFGFLAVRVAKSIAEYFGTGRLTNSEGLVGEKNNDGKPNIFGKKARWMDYSGPVVGSKGVEVTEGITYFDHPSNPSYPSGWHVREDGWMGCSPCMFEAIETTRANPLKLRFLLHAHADAVDARVADQVAADFAKLPKLDVIKSRKRHTAFEIIEA